MPGGGSTSNGPGGMPVTSSAAMMRMVEARRTVMMFFTPRMAMLAPLFWYTGFNQPYQLNTYGNRFFDSRALGIELAAFYAAAKRGGLGAARRPELEDEPNRISSKNGQEQTVPNSGTPGSAAPVCVVVGPFRGSDVRDAVRASAHPAAAGASWSPRARATPRRVVPFTAELARACVFLADVDRGFDEENTKRGGGGGGGGGRMGAANGGV